MCSSYGYYARTVAIAAAVAVVADVHTHNVAFGLCFDASALQHSMSAML